MTSSAETMRYSDALWAVREKTRQGVRHAARLAHVRSTRTSEKAIKTLHRQALYGLIDGIADEIITRAAPGKEVPLSRRVAEELVQAVAKKVDIYRE